MDLDALIIDKPLYGSLMVLVDLFLKGVLILAGARLVTAMLSRSAAAARHLVWATALLVILLLPLFSTLLPEVNIPLFERPFQEQSAQMASEGSDASVFAVSSEQPLAFYPQKPATERLSKPAPVDELSADLNKAPLTPLPLTGEIAASNEAGRFLNPYTGALNKLHWTALVMGGWGMGVIFVLGWTVLGIAGAWWITRRSRPSEDESWSDLNDEIADRLMIYRPVHLLMSTSISSPMTWGVWRPVILLPVDADDWSEDRRRYVLLHEMAHIKRWDTLTQFGAQISCAMHWFNPLAWKGLDRLRIEQEKACDDLVLAHGLKASEYARHLLDIARSLKMPWVSPLNTISMAKPSQLEGRVVEILDPDRKKRTINNFGAAFTCLLTLLVMLPISALSPWLQSGQNVVTEGPVLATVENRAGWDKPVLVYEKPRDAAGAVSGVQPASKQQEATPVLADNSVLTKRSSELRVAPFRVDPVAADTSEKQRRARKTAIKALRSALDDENAEVRKHAAMALGELGDEGAIEYLVHLLQTDSDKEVRKHAIISLLSLDSPDVIDAYIVALNDKDIEVRRYAVQGLSEMDSDAATKALLFVLDDKDREIRRYALIGLADAREEKALPAIKKALTDADPEIRRFAVTALAEYDSDASLKLLHSALEDEDAEVRRHVLIALEDRADAESLPIIINMLLSDKSPEIRRHAAIALGEIGDLDAVEPLTHALKDKDVEVRRYAMIALGQLDYGEDDEDNDAWRGDLDSEDVDEWDSNNLRGIKWEGAEAEAFGNTMAKLGASAGQLGIAVGELSLNLTSDVLAELAFSLENLDFEDDLASVEHGLHISEMELNEKIYELRDLQYELEKEWSEEAFQSILEAIDELEPVLLGNPTLCEQAARIFNNRSEGSKRRTRKKLECGNQLILRD